MKKSIGFGQVVATGAFLALAVVVGCGEENGLVGGVCRYPYVECDLRCVDLATDPEHCGACDSRCASGVACVSGVCGGKGDGGPSDVLVDAATDGLLPDGRSDGQTGEDGSLEDGSLEDGSTDGALGDGSGGDGALGDGASGDGASGDGSSGDGSASEGGTDGGVGDGSTSDSSVSDAGVGDGSASDGAVTDGAITDANGGDACPPPPYSSDNHCGACNAKCTAPNDTCRPQGGGGFACEPFCAPPLSRCGNTCKDLQTDGDNCGVCGRVCASNICIAGVCQGAASGDIVYIGHDYRMTPLKTAQARLLENSVLLAPKTPVRVLVYQRYAAAGSVAQVNAILADAATRTGRAIQITATSTDAAVSAATTSSYEVVLVHDQIAAPNGALATLGASWATGLADFTHVGGVFVALDGATGTGQMPALVTSTGLLSVTSHTSVSTGELLELISPTDGVGQQVVTPFAMRLYTSRFDTEANGNRVSWVVRHQSSGAPNVVHKIAP